MFEIDRAKFGEFIAMLRKEKGMTQKELAEKLFISDKAVSKWETGKSIPDITLLVPLSELLEVSVTELLECRRIEQKESIDMEKTDELVKKVIGLTEEEQGVFARIRKRKKHICIYLICVFLAIVEMVCFFGLREAIPVLPVLMEQLFVVWILTIGFGCYFWIFIKEKLPAYYDENEISIYVDGILHMNFPGVHYNNHNWPHIVKALRVWSVVGMVFFPIIYILIMANLGNKVFLLELFLILGFLLGGLFLPIIIVGRKYQYETGKEPVKRDNHNKQGKTISGIIVWSMVILLVIACIALHFLGVGTSFSGTKIAYISKVTKAMWSAEYEYLNGYMQRTLVVPEEEGMIAINVETEEGTFSIEIKDTNGNVIFEKDELEDARYKVEASGKVKVRIDADRHKGSFQIGE